MKRLFVIATLMIGILCFLALDADIAKTRTQDPDSATCLECHADADMVGEAYAVDAAHFAETPHNEEETGITCVDCHVQAMQVEDVYDHGELGPADCSSCHGDVMEELTLGGHNPEAEGVPNCATCHGFGHGILYAEDPQSPAFKLNQPETCAQCHNSEVVGNFMQSVHGNLLQQGHEEGPACSTCHDAHRSPMADIVRNPTFKIEVANTCGRCHSDVMAVFRESIHGEMLLRKNEVESASCADCHSSHQIRPPDDPASTVFPTHVIDDCAACHADPKIIRHFNMQPDIVSTYEESYHGRATGLGDAKVANCTSCHTYHTIFDTTDPRSPVYPDNLQQTCSTCHPGATENFVQGKIHAPIGDKENNFAAYFVKNLYIVLIVVVIGGMVMHNILDFIRKMINRARHQKAEPYIRRMTGLERFLHASLAISFILLVYTGFALLYPSAWWVAPINMIENSEEFRSLLHRVCGVILTAVSLHHLWFMFFNKRGIEQRRHFMPRLKDARDIWDNIMWYFGKRKQRPRFDRFTYMEKAEYWALVWGTAVMVVTGFILWFEDIAMIFMPRWLWEVALIVHLFEAILATLAIVVWHFYFVMINPDESPLSLTFITGRMTLKELAHVHPEEFERVAAEREAEQKEKTTQEKSSDTGDKSQR